MCLTILGSTIASFVDIHSILFSGPIGLVVGLVLTILAIRQRLHYSKLFGLSAIVVTVGLFGVINILNWGPTDAERPVPIILVCYSVVSIPFGLVQRHSLMKRDSSVHRELE